MFSGFYHSLSIRLGRSSRREGLSVASDSASESLRAGATTRATSQLQNTRLTTAGFASFICHAAHLEDFLSRGEKSGFFDGNEIQTTSRSPAGAGGFFTVDRARLADPSVAKGSRFVAVKTPKDQTE